MTYTSPLERLSTNRCRIVPSSAHTSRTSSSTSAAKLGDSSVSGSNMGDSRMHCDGGTGAGAAGAATGAAATAGIEGGASEMPLDCARACITAARDDAVLRNPG
eukprot:Amastigsp_a9037_6.p3 type:complete len:104 gc:universal Amastigsp_a9037_6:130-441(+)